MLCNGTQDNPRRKKSLASDTQAKNPNESIIVGKNGTNGSENEKPSPCANIPKSDPSPSPTGRRKRRCREKETETDGPESKRKRQEEKPTSKTNGSVTKKSSSEKLDFAWICTECNEAECLENPEAELILCEGKCNRPFHYNCADLSHVPSSEEEWICEDCQKGRHQCAICHQYGADEEDVYFCDKQGCGLFFHESCLRMQNVEVQVIETKISSAVEQEEEEGLEVEPAIMTKLSFICPAHSCWSCTEDYEPPDDDETPVKKQSKGKKKSRKSNNFASKRDPNLYRCLHCPIAYHIDCFPPMARFHELALLCHQHAATNKLPYLDMETSVQGGVEAKAAKKLAERNEIVRRKEANGAVMNTFFPGVVCDSLFAHEEKLLPYLQKEDPDHDYLLDGLPFCLSCDCREEVHSKPPSYRHVHSLRYNSSNRPKRKPPSDGTCECKSKRLPICDESCLNRMVMIECIGDVSKSNGEKNKYWNCDLGPSCSNRSLGQRNFAKCRPMREQGKGWGLVTINGVKKGELVQEYVGEVIDEEEKESRLHQWARDHPNDPNFYVMALDSGWYIDARNEANLSRFINHSCAPNCRLVPLNVGGYMHVGIYSLTDIAPGQFLSYDYQFDTKHGDKFRCRCGAANCRGTMKGGKGEGMDEAVEHKTRREEWEEAKARFERDRKYLEEAEKKEDEQACQVDALVPGADHVMETVAAGPNEKYRKTAQDSRLFLWRNVCKGENFSERPLSNKRTRPHSTETTRTADLLSNDSSFEL